VRHHVVQLAGDPQPLLIDLATGVPLGPVAERVDVRPAVPIAMPAKSATAMSAGTMMNPPLTAPNGLFAAVAPMSTAVVSSAQPTERRIGRTVASDPTATAGRSSDAPLTYPRRL
jgi:hypothetical protein